MLGENDQAIQRLQVGYQTPAMSKLAILLRRYGNHKPWQHISNLMPYLFLDTPKFTAVVISSHW